MADENKRLCHNDHGTEVFTDSGADAGGTLTRATILMTYYSRGRLRLIMRKDNTLIRVTGLERLPYVLPVSELKERAGRGRQVMVLKRSGSIGHYIASAHGLR